MRLLAVAAVLLSLVNAQRSAHHVHPVAEGPAPMGLCDETEPLACVRRHHVRTLAVGVITAWGFRSASDFIQGWLNSPPHRHIMLDPAYRRGTAYCYAPDTCRVVFVR